MVDFFFTLCILVYNISFSVVNNFKKKKKMLPKKNFKKSKYQTDIYNKCTTGKSDWICKSCYNSMMKNKMPVHAQLNNMKLVLNLVSWIGFV